ncbi:MAG: TetR/AcrR family transcriptional regulator [Myxococcales bacterium]|nr:TetR/AcrR family transcriptional regulator [Myxococcales bacterium]MBL0196199.1 TetR/AcrR family transcriptional regulator [Myxococcales bacterium]HQY63406.1 TetR/AcrR family transcriptional regulator [Polyangiaceae bacterium]
MASRAPTSVAPSKRPSAKRAPSAAKRRARAVAPIAEPSTEARILEAGEALFCAVGYAGVSARDVAERAGVNKALVFYHYGSMRGLFEAVLERYYDAHHRGLADALAGGGDVRERMHRLVDAYLDFMATHARYATLVQAQLANPDTYALVEKSFEPLYRFVEATLLEVAPEQGRAAARQLFVTFSGAVINWCTYAPLLSRVLGGDLLRPPLLEERRAHVRWLVDLVLADLQRSPPSGSLPAVGAVRASGRDPA